MWSVDKQKETHRKRCCRLPVTIILLEGIIIALLWNFVEVRYIVVLLCLLPVEGTWMNDPNGLLDWSGIKHVFYQFNPFEAVWGSMHWGHVASRNMAR